MRFLVRLRNALYISHIRSRHDNYRYAVRHPLGSVICAGLHMVVRIYALVVTIFALPVTIGILTGYFHR